MSKRQLFAGTTGLLLVIYLSAGCANQRCAAKGPPIVPPPTVKTVVAAPDSSGNVPPFVMAALRGPHAKRFKISVAPGGRATKFSVYVTREAIPAWVFELANKELGQGEDVEYEVEQYGDGDQVYEITRRVNGKLLELSARAHGKTKLYVEHKDLPAAQMPSAIAKAAATVAGLTVKRFERKDYANGRQLFEVHGDLGGREMTLYIKPDGRITQRLVGVPATIKIEPAAR